MSHIDYIIHLEELDRQDSRERGRSIDYAEEATAKRVTKNHQGQWQTTTEEWLMLQRLAN